MAKNTLPSAPIPASIELSMRSSSLFDRDDPDSVFNRSQGELREAVLRVEQSKMGIRNTKLPPKLIKELIKPDPRDAKMRQGFWEEYARAVDRDSYMRVEFIAGGVTSFEVFCEDYLLKPEMMGYLMNCPASYVRNTEDLLNVALDRLRDILELPLVNHKGQVQPAVVAGILKAAEMLDKRVKGAVLQKVAVHQHHTQGAIESVPGGTLAQDELAMLEKQIQDVRKKMNEKYALLPGSQDRGTIVVEKARDDEKA